MNIFSPKRQDEEIFAFLITWVTHSARVFERMVHFGVRRGEAVWLSADAELQITQSIARIVEEDEVQILAYNICGDHVHLVLVSGEEEVPKMVQKLKAVSAKEYHVSRGMTRLGVTEKEYNKKGMNKGACSLVQKGIRGKAQNHLWAQKYNTSYIYNEEQLQSAVQYVEYNRAKHGLPETEELRALIQKMICSYEEAFSLSQMPCS